MDSRRSGNDDANSGRRGIAGVIRSVKLCAYTGRLIGQVRCTKDICMLQFRGGLRRREVVIQVSYGRGCGEMTTGPLKRICEDGHCEDAEDTMVEVVVVVVVVMVVVLVVIMRMMAR